MHVHLEATVRPEFLREIARRNNMPVTAGDVAGPAGLSRYRDFSHFIAAWIAASSALQRERDFREVVIAYAAEAAAQGCVYIEAIFSPAEPVRRGTSWDEVFEGYCSGAEEAYRLHGVHVRLTPEITRDFSVEEGEEVARHAVRARERGVVGLGLGGSEARYPAELFARAFAIARAGGLRAAPHAGESAGPASVRAALDVLHARRLRHGVRAVEDPGLLAELAARGIVCDVTPTSNLLLGVVLSLAGHPLPRMLAAGVRCSVSSDDPALLGTNLTHECDLAAGLGHSPRAMFEHAVEGAFCEEALKTALRRLSDAFAWGAVAPCGADGAEAGASPCVGAPPAG